ncbi:hypothetical protein AUP68_12743 [Ilyonectria robusta]
MTDNAGANTSARRTKEEFESAKSKLVDQKFTMSMFYPPHLCQCRRAAPCICR